MEFSISKHLIASYINHHEFATENNVLKEYEDMKDAIKILRKEINLVYIAKEILISEK